MAILGDNLASVQLACHIATTYQDCAVTMLLSQPSLLQEIQPDLPTDVDQPVREFLESIGVSILQGERVVTVEYEQQVTIECESGASLLSKNDNPSQGDSLNGLS